MSEIWENRFFILISVPLLLIAMAVGLAIESVSKIFEKTKKHLKINKVESEK